MKQTVNAYFRRVLGAAALMLSCTASHAAITPFNVTYDGTSVSVDAGSAIPGGTVLAAGDGFNLNLRAAGNDFWTLTAAYSSFVPLSFWVAESADRVADITTSFRLNGVTVFSIVDVDTGQSSVHVGAQTWNLAAGLMFDEVDMAWSLDSSTSALTTINTVPGLFTGFGLPSSPFYTDSRFNYNSAAVPEPGSLALMIGAGLALMALSGRRNRGA